MSADHAPLTRVGDYRMDFALEHGPGRTVEHRYRHVQNLDPAIRRVQLLSALQETAAEPDYKFLGSVPWAVVMGWLEKNAPGPNAMNRFATDKELKARFLKDYLSGDFDKLLAHSARKVRGHLNVR